MRRPARIRLVSNAIVRQFEQRRGILRNGLGPGGHRLKRGPLFGIHCGTAGGIPGSVSCVIVRPSSNRAGPYPPVDAGFDLGDRGAVLGLVGHKRGVAGIAASHDWKIKSGRRAAGHRNGGVRESQCGGGEKPASGALCQREAEPVYCNAL